MSAPRTFLRLAICGLFMSALAAACTVKEADDTDDDTSCNPGDSRDCNCSDGESGTRKCNSAGDGYLKCVCASGTGGTESGAGEGTGASAGTGGYGGGTGGYAGSGGYSGTATGGADTVEGGSGGAGGSGDVLPAECAEDDEDLCATCYQTGCCEEWSACFNDAGAGGDDCLTQFFNIMACAQIDRETKDTTPDDLRVCAEEEVDGGGAWSDGLRPQVKPLIDCVAVPGWSASSSFAASGGCKVSCFDKL